MELGAVAHLSWSVIGAIDVAIDQGVGQVKGGASSIYVSPAQTTTYTLTAVSGSTKVSQQVTVTVVASAPNPPATGSVFYVSPSGNDGQDGRSPSTAWRT
ncbi:MAG: hypothetical protein M3N41_08165, partial [Acidobacteriota bacterium]|nr:hypothetical protein [Acidobacteriota bacterium]